MLGKALLVCSIASFLFEKVKKSDVCFFPCTPPPSRYSSHTLELESGKTQPRPCEVPCGGGGQSYIHFWVLAAASGLQLQWCWSCQQRQSLLWAKPQQRLPWTSSTGQYASLLEKQSSSLFIQPYQKFYEWSNTSFC